MAKPIGVYQVYDGLIAQWRREGYSLQEIGDRVGVTRERIRQILHSYFGVDDIKSCLVCRRVCLVCGKRISLTRKYCPGCSVILRKNRWRRWTQGQKEEHRERCRKWRESHPEKYREIQSRASRKYEEKRRAKHFVETTYVVTPQQQFDKRGIINYKK